MTREPRRLDLSHKLISTIQWAYALAPVVGFLGEPDGTYLNYAR